MVQKWIMGGLILLCVSSFFIAVSLGIEHISYKNSIIRQTTERLEKITEAAAAQIDAITLEVMTSAGDLASRLSSSETSVNRERRVEEELKKVITGNRFIYGGSITYRPHAFPESREKGLFSNYFYKREGKLVFLELEKDYDYAVDKTYDWYLAPMDSGSSRWSIPYYDEAGRTVMITYSAVFYEKEKSGRQIPLGVVTLDISIDDLKDIVESLDLGPGGYGALTSRDGIYLYHPKSEYAITQKSILEVAAEHNDKDRLFLGNEFLKDPNIHGLIRHVSTTTGKLSWLAYEPIPSCGWSLQNTFIRDDVSIDLDDLRHQLINITIFTLLFIWTLGMLFLRVHEGATSHLWYGTALTSILLAGGIGLLWYLSLSFDPKSDSASKKDSTTLQDKATIKKVVEDYRLQSEERKTEPPRYIPTGILIKSIRFSTERDPVITGYVWQVFSRDLPQEIPRAFVIDHSEDLKVEEVYRSRGKDPETIRWYFQATVGQRFGHDRYPLERENVTLRILTKGLNQSVVLLPDLSSYRLINPTSKPGLDNDVSISGWEIEKTFFDHVENDPDTTLGIRQSLLREDFPTLRFNIVMKRNFLDSFISNLTPLIVVSFMLFAILMTMTNDEKMVSKMRTGSGMALSLSSALFFVVVFSHIGIRQRISAEEIFYLEYFYFIIYLAIMWVSSSSILFSMATNLAFYQYKDNLISKLLYWPILLGSLFFVTVYTFY